MNPWLGKIAIGLGVVVLIAIRIPHAGRGRKVKVVETRKSVMPFHTHASVRAPECAVSWLATIHPELHYRGEPVAGNAHWAVIANHELHSDGSANGG